MCEFYCVVFCCRQSLWQRLFLLKLFISPKIVCVVLCRVDFNYLHCITRSVGLWEVVAICHFFFFVYFVYFVCLLFLFLFCFVMFSFLYSPWLWLYLLLRLLELHFDMRFIALTTATATNKTFTTDGLLNSWYAQTLRHVVCCGCLHSGCMALIFFFFFFAHSNASFHAAAPAFDCIGRLENVCSPVVLNS